MHENVIQHLIDIRNKQEVVEDKIDANRRLLVKIAQRLATADSDKKKTKQLTAELTAIAAELESADVASTPDKPA